MSKINLNLDFDAIRERIDKEKEGLKPSFWADKVGVSRNVITNIHGSIKQKPSLEYIVAVSVATSKSIEYYLWGEKTSIPKTKRELSPFLDQPRADRIIQNLAILERTDPARYNKVEGYIDAQMDNPPQKNAAAETRNVIKKTGT